MKFFTLLTISALILLVTKINCQTLQFTENKGQWDRKVKYAAAISNGSIFLQPSGYKILLNNQEDLTRISNYFSGHNTNKSSRLLDRDADNKLVLHSHAYEVKFLHAANATITAEDESLSYSNYFLGADANHWASHCRIFSSITYKNVYPNIDIKYYESKGDFKYDFIVHPGGDVSKIQLYFDGIENLQLSEKNLLIKTSVSNVKELQPFTYQSKSALQKVVATSYVVNGNIVSFKVANYDHTQTLTIDPSIIFSSFTGSKDDNWGYCSTYDTEGNFYSGSIVFGAGFPVTNGAFETLFQGGDGTSGLGAHDVVIAKFNSSGSKLIYSTYLGGGGNEEPEAMKVNSKGELVIMGTTTSSNFPSTYSSLGVGGDIDLFISILSSDGSSLNQSRKIGGSSRDGINIRAKYEGPLGALSIRRSYDDDCRKEIAIDDNDNIYLGACTQSSDFPVTNNAFQKSLFGLQDGIVLKLMPDLSTAVFSSFIGSGGEDAVFGICLNPVNKRVYIAGATTATNFPGVSSTSLYKNFQGGVCDGFISSISADGSVLYGSSYIGTAGNDLIYKLDVDQTGFPYIMGTTTSDVWPVVNAPFSQAKGKQFIGKLSMDLSQWMYSTVFGKGASTPDISPTAFFIDNCENVYIAGWGGGINKEGYPNASTAGLTVTPDALQATTDSSDFYFFVLEKNATRQLYGSFFGEVGGLGDHTDGGSSRFDKNGILYLSVCANCRKEGVFPTTPGAWSNINNANTGAKCNAAAVKIDFNLSSKCLLPVTLTAFSVALQNKTSILNWSTAQELNLSHFQIERSSDARNFMPLGQVAVKSGNSNVRNDYSFTDKKPVVGKNYYRLNIVDKDGKQTYSSVRSINYTAQLNVKINSNPTADNKLSLVINSEKNEKLNFTAINAEGKTVLSKSISVMQGEALTSIDISHLPTGIYFLLVHDDAQKINLKFIK